MPGLGLPKCRANRESFKLIVSLFKIVKTRNSNDVTVEIRIRQTQESGKKMRSRHKEFMRNKCWTAHWEDKIMAKEEGNIGAK